MWGSSCQAQLIRLRKLQQKAFGLIDRNFSLPSFYFEHKVLAFNAVYHYFTLVRFYKYFILGQEYFFQNFFNGNIISHVYSTRDRESKNFNLPVINSSKFFHSFVYNAIVLWNKLPTPIKNCIDLRSFKLHIRELISNQF